MLKDKKGKVLVKHSYLVQHQLPWHNQFRKFPFLTLQLSMGKTALSKISTLDSAFEKTRIWWMFPSDKCRQKANPQSKNIVFQNNHGYIGMGLQSHICNISSTIQPEQKTVKDIEIFLPYKTLNIICVKKVKNFLKLYAF